VVRDSNSQLRPEAGWYQRFLKGRRSVWEGCAQMLCADLCYSQIPAWRAWADVTDHAVPLSFIPTSPRWAGHTQPGPRGRRWPQPAVPAHTRMPLPQADTAVPGVYCLS
jgi:hypothetical protein